MPNPKPARGNVQVQKWCKATCLLQYTDAYQIQLTIPRGQSPAAQCPEETDDSHVLIAGAFPIEDGTRGAKAV